jgi:hypothetical protein
MISVTKEILAEQANKLNLIYWQAIDGTTEIARQDENVGVEQSMQQLAELIDSLQPYARPNDKLIISMQSDVLTPKGKPKGLIARKFTIALNPTAAPGGSLQISGANYSLQKENEELRLKLITKELEDKHSKERDELLKRIEALEGEPGGDMDKTIGQINTLLSHPLAQIIVSQFFQQKAPAPAINGVPEEGAELFKKWLEVDSQALEVMRGIIKLATEQPTNYNLYKPMLLK